MSSLDLSRAFDTVSWEAMTYALQVARVPQPFINYMKSVYESGVSVLNDGSGQNVNVKAKRRVRQGDPLSPLLYNLVIDLALKSLPEEVGYDIGGTRVNALAFADDVILLSSTRPGMVSSLEAFVQKVEGYGLLLNTSKSGTLSIVASGRQKKVKVCTGEPFLVAGTPLPQIDLGTVWKYLGVNFQGMNVRVGQNTIKRMLERITRAPLKPQQRLKILRMYLIPRYQHIWVMGPISARELTEYDRDVRAAARSWLRLPKDVPVGFFHAGIKVGGLGIPLLRRAIPLLRMNRLAKLKDSTAPAAVAASGTDIVTQQLDWCKRMLTVGGVVLDTKMKLAEHLKVLLWDSVDGRDLRDHVDTPESSWWVDNAPKSVTGKDYIQHWKVKTSSLPARARTTRGRPQLDRLCRAGCNVPETPAHCVQRCPRSHASRVMRHDVVCEALKKDLDTRGYTVHKEPSLKTSLGLRKPDIVACRLNTITCTDVQVVSNSFVALRECHQNKIAKYRDIEGIRSYLVSRYGNSPNTEVQFTSATLSWRGFWCKESVRDLTNMVRISKQTLRYIPLKVLRGSHMCWGRFNDSAEMYRRRGH